MLGIIIIMSDNVESLKMRKCTRCLQKYPVDDWGMKPNGDYYQYCNVCRVENRAEWHMKSQDIKDTAAQNAKEKMLYDSEYRTKRIEQTRLTGSRLVKCPICDREVSHYGLSSHKKSKVCKASVPVV